MCLESLKFGYDLCSVGSSISCSFIYSYITLPRFFKGEESKKLYSNTSWKRTHKTIKKIHNIHSRNELDKMLSQPETQGLCSLEWLKQEPSSLHSLTKITFSAPKPTIFPATCPLLPKIVTIAFFLLLHLRTTGHSPYIKLVSGFKPSIE